jgi:hypothetical protein
MTKIAKTIEGTIVEIVVYAGKVEFSPEVGWIFICFDFHRAYAKRSSFKWVRSTTPFTWVRDFI